MLDWKGLAIIQPIFHRFHLGNTENMSDTDSHKRQSQF